MAHYPLFTNPNPAFAQILPIACLWLIEHDLHFPWLRQELSVSGYLWNTWLKWYQIKKFTLQGPFNAFFVSICFICILWFAGGVWSTVSSLPSAAQIPPLPHVFSEPWCCLSVLAFIVTVRHDIEVSTSLHLQRHFWLLVVQGWSFHGSPDRRKSQSCGFF